jgi:hypothetical protein
MNTCTNKPQTISGSEIRRLTEVNKLYAIYCVIGTLAYLALSRPIAHYTGHIPDYDTNSETFQSMYYRYYVWTKYLPLG